MASQTTVDDVPSCTIEASVPTGFESVAADEAKEMFNTDCKSTRGKITFQTPIERVQDILKLGGIDHCRCQILHVPHFGFTADGDDCLARLQLLVKQCDWTEGLDIWSKFYTFDHPIAPQPPTIPTDQELIDVCHSVHMPGPQGKKKRVRKDRRKGNKGREGGRGSKAGDEKQKEEGSMDISAGAPGQVPEASPAAGDVGSRESQSVPPELQHDTTEAGVEDSGRGPESVQEEQQSPVKKLKECGDAGDLPCVQATVSDDPASQSSEMTVTESVVSPDKSATETDPGREEVKTNQGESQETKASPSMKKPRDPTKPVFRVTCKRTGENHSFDSMSAAASVGSAVQTYFGWSVDMTRFNIEVVLTIDNNEVSVGLALTPESLHKRNLVAFGVTTLRPTICHNMLRMVKIRPGHVVCDPLCGTASIPIQGALRFPALQLCGDNHKVAMEKTGQNKDALNAKLKSKGSGGLRMDAVQWNACHLPLRDGLVDVFVSDLPFGKRVGRKSENIKLYCDLLDEMARCGKKTGRAALLTGDINNMVKAVQGQKYWTRRRCYSCNIGGIPAAVFLLCRSALPYTPRSGAPHKHSARPRHNNPPPPSGHNGPDHCDQDQKQEPLPATGSGTDQCDQD